MGKLAGFTEDELAEMDAFAFVEEVLKLAEAYECRDEWVGVKGVTDDGIVVAWLSEPDGYGAGGYVSETELPFAFLRNPNEFLAERKAKREAESAALNARWAAENARRERAEFERLKAKFG